MRKVNTKDIAPESWSSPKGNFIGSGIEVSIALGRDPRSTDLRQRHPFDVEILHIPPGKTPYPFHSHSAQWEFYHVVTGKGVVRSEAGRTPIEPGDAFIFEPGQAHQLINDGPEELVVYVVADNPLGESFYYPDSKKVSAFSPERKLVRSEPLDYYDGEE
jgi:uncharacterized cupin superfamily protein